MDDSDYDDVDYGYQDDNWDNEEYDDEDDYNRYSYYEYDDVQPTLRQRIKWRWQASRLRSLLRRIWYFRRHDPLDDIPW